MADYRQTLSSRPGKLFVSTKPKSSSLAEGSRNQTGSQNQNHLAHFQPRSYQPQSATTTVCPTFADLSSQTPKPDTGPRTSRRPKLRNLRDGARQLLHHDFPSHVEFSVADYSLNPAPSVNAKLWHPWASYSVPMVPDYAHAVRSVCHGQSSGIGPAEKPIVSGDGIHVFVALAEPVLILQGFHEHDSTSEKVLRGALNLRVSQSVKIKELTLRFRGVANTIWPESWRVRHMPSTDVVDIVNHTWPLFNVQAGNGLLGHGADHVFPLKGSGQSLTGDDATDGAPSYDDNVEEHPSAVSESTAAQHRFDTFTPGDYIYNFELPISSRLPETTKMELGSVRYELEAVVVRPRTFESRLTGFKEVTLIRTPSEDSLETVEPIIISKKWDDQLGYDITIHGSSFPLGAQVPVLIKLRPLADVRLHSTRVFLVEHVHYYTQDRRMYRLESARKALLFERRIDESDTSTLHEHPDYQVDDDYVAPDEQVTATEVKPTPLLNTISSRDGEHGATTVMKLALQLPGCQDATKVEDQVHFDTTYSCINVKHSIRVGLLIPCHI